MFKKIVSAVCVAIFMTTVFFSCAKAPSQAVVKTQLAVDEAKALEADIYFPLKFMALRDSLNVAVALIDQEKSSFFLGRNYERAETLLLDVHAEITALTEKTALKKEETKLEVKQMFVDMKIAIDDMRSTMQGAAKVRNNRKLINTAEFEIVLIESEMPIINQLLEGGQYLTAWNKATEKLEKLSQLNQDFLAAVARPGANKAKA